MRARWESMHLKSTGGRWTALSSRRMMTSPSYGRSVSRYAVCIPAYRSGPLLVAWNKPFPCILGPQEATPLDRQADEKEEGQVR